MKFGFCKGSMKYDMLCYNTVCHNSSGQGTL